jgi:hypothetical protein
VGQPCGRPCTSTRAREDIRVANVGEIRPAPSEACPGSPGARRSCSQGEETRGRWGRLKGQDRRPARFSRKARQPPAPAACACVACAGRRACSATAASGAKTPNQIVSELRCARVGAGVNSESSTLTHDPHRHHSARSTPSDRRCPRTRLYGRYGSGEASRGFSTYYRATDCMGSQHKHCNRRRSGDGCMRRRTFSLPSENRP